MPRYIVERIFADGLQVPLDGQAVRPTPDLFTGTGNFSIPIAVPPDRIGPG